MSNASSADYWKAVSQIAASLQDRRLCVLAGAGISIGRSSNLPGWSELVYAMLDVLRPSSAGPASEVLAEDEGLLLNEVVLKVLDENVGRAATISALRACFGTSAFSAIHHCLAEMAIGYGGTVVTTNYDMLIEASIPSTALIEKVIHAHGTLKGPDEMRFTEANVFSQLPEQLRGQVREAVAGRYLLVCGYRGADEFDVMPAIFRSDTPPRAVIWIYHREAPDAQVLEWIEGVDSIILGADVDLFLADVWRALHPSIGDAATLADVFSATASPNPPQWWRNEIESWGRETLKSDQRDVRLVWPTILERFAPKTPKAAATIISAYEHVLAQWSGQTDVESINERMLPWLAIAKRIGSEDLRAATERLGKSLHGTSEIQARSHLARRLGAVLHEYGRVLDTESSFERSDQALMEAWRVRRSAGEPKAAYSIFQVFMHARARFLKNGPSEELHLPFDFATLENELDDAREAFLREGEPRHASTMTHNRAFLMEFRGKHGLGTGADRGGLTTVKSAKLLYEEAAKVRRSLRAPQLYHRSLLRLAECDLWILQHDNEMSDRGRHEGSIIAMGRLSQLENEEDVDPQILREVERIRKTFSGS